MNGYDVARALRADAGLRSAYLIALTGYGRAEDMNSAREAGFDLHVTKPASIEDLKSAVARAGAPAA
jgi:CheY-like chemotaxis protein